MAARGRAGPVELTGAKELKALVRDLDKYADSKEIRKRLRQELKDTSSDVVPAVRAAIKKIPSKGQTAKQGRPSLRSRLSAAALTRVRVAKTSVAITAMVAPGKMPPGERSLPMQMEGTIPTWNPPLFGNKNYLHRQQAHPFFFGAVEPFGNRIEQDVIAVADSIRKDLES